MKFFWFFCQNSIFRAFLLFSRDLRLALRSNSTTWSGQKYMTWISLKKRKNALKMAILTKNQKISWKQSWRPLKVVYYGLFISWFDAFFGNAYLQKMKYWQSPSYDFWNFSYFKLPWHSSNSFCWVSQCSPIFLFKIPNRSQWTSGRIH